MYKYLNVFILCILCGCKDKANNYSGLKTNSLDPLVSDSTLSENVVLLEKKRLKTKRSALTSRNSFSVFQDSSILKLPFGKDSLLEKKNNASIDYYLSLIGQNLRVGSLSPPEYAHLYQLPPVHIQKMKVFNLSSFNRGYCIYNSVGLDSVLNFTSYNYRLVNKDDLEIYYYTNTKDRESIFKAGYECENFNFDYYGYLLVYDRNRHSITSFPIFYELSSDGAYFTREFYIDSAYNIFFNDYGYDYDEVENKIVSSLSGKYKLNIVSGDSLIIDIVN